jgi:hypothetical protein
MDKIKIYRKCGKKYDYYYRFFCEECKKDRGYLPNKKSSSLCKSCAGKISHANISEETKEKMSKAKKGIQTWNKGLTNIYSEETKKNMGVKNIGSIPYNKGVEMSLEQKIKLSCTNRDINLEDFDDFTMPESKRERCKFKTSGLREQCFEKADYTCDITGKKGCELNAHHLESWHSNEELRYDIDNLVCISKEMHDEFHRVYGRKNNTKEQYEKFKRSYFL